MADSIYDNPIFFDNYQKLRTNPHSFNELIEKPTMYSLLPNLQGKKLLDLGCGTGEHLQYYAQYGAKYLVGIDLSQSMLTKAEQKLSKLIHNKTAYRLYQLPMQQLNNLTEANFDIITSSYAFHYIEDLEALLTAIYAKLTPNGTLIFSQEHPIVTCYIEGYRWEKDNNKQQVAYRLNHYRQEGERQRKWFQQPFKTYHRTTATIINTLIKVGFTLQQIAEPMWIDQIENSTEIFPDLAHRPPILFIKAIKL